MKRALAGIVVLGAILVGTGCTSSSRRNPPLSYQSEFSTAARLWRADLDIEKRAESLQRKGLSAEEANQYAEIEYLKSRAGSPLR